MSNSLDAPEINDPRKMPGYQGAQIFMIIVSILWGFFTLIDLVYATMFGWIFALTGALGADTAITGVLSLLYYNLWAFPIMVLIALVGGFTSKSKGNFTATYIFGLLPIINIILFFVFINMLPGAAMSN